MPALPQWSRPLLVPQVGSGQLGIWVLGRKLGGCLVVNERVVGQPLDCAAHGATPNPATMVRLAQVYIATGKLDNASFTLDKAINTPNVPPQVKSIAESMKADIAKRKPAAPAAAPGSATPPASSAPAGSEPPAKQP